jgi:hypothetical protein
VADVRIPAAISYINGGSQSLHTLEEAADNELAHIQGNRISISKRRRK